MKNITVDVLPTTGSPRGIIPEDIYNRGVGGAELFGMNLWKQLTKHGYKVRYYNDPRVEGVYDGVEYLRNESFISAEERDILITFRGYDPRAGVSRHKKHIGISCDQYTNEYNYKDVWYPSVNEMVGISEFHKKDHVQRYGDIANKMTVIDIGADTNEYNLEIDKIPYQVLFSSVPDRGLDLLCDYWGELKSKVPQLKLIITSDYRLWGNHDAGNQQFRLRFAGKPDVQFLGKVSRYELIQYQLQSEALLYPCIYDENFGIAVAESQIAGCYPITSNKGALETTNRFGTRIELNNSFKQNFIETVEKYFSFPFEERSKVSNEIKIKAKKLWDWKNILPQWLEVLKID